jgi:hypothetical protein
VPVVVEVPVVGVVIQLLSVTDGTSREKIPS